MKRETLRTKVTLDSIIFVKEKIIANVIKSNTDGLEIADTIEAQMSLSKTLNAIADNRLTKFINGVTND